MAKTITSANSQFILSAPDILATDVALQGYAADDAFSNEAFDIAETIMGVDARMSAGYVPAIKKISLMFMPDSPSLPVWFEIVGNYVTYREISFLSATIVLPSIGVQFFCSRGVLKNLQLIPAAKKVLQAVPYVLDFEDIQVQLI